MKRRTLGRTIVSFFSVIAVLIVVESFRTLHVMELWVFHGPAGQPLAVGCERGVLYLMASEVPIERAGLLTVDHERWMPITVNESFDDIAGRSTRELGFKKSSPFGYRAAQPIAYGFSVGYGFDALGVPHTWYVFASVPAWFIGPLLAIYPLRRSIIWWRSRRRRKRGLCPVCAYDLRQSPERCPECGYVRASI